MRHYQSHRAGRPRRIASNSTSQKGLEICAALFGLASSGVYISPPRRRKRRCALTAPFHPYIRLPVRGTFLLHFPWGRPRWVLPSTLPYDARTFLTRQKRVRGCPAYSFLFNGGFFFRFFFYCGFFLYGFFFIVVGIIFFVLFFIVVFGGI